MCNRFIYPMVLIIWVITCGNAFSQDIILRKMKEKAEKKVAEEIFKEKETPPAGQPQEPAEQEPSGGKNRKGGGLSTDAPDVEQSLREAETAFYAKKYGDSKAAVRKALWAVEIEIGKKLLGSLPEQVEKASFRKEQDKVSSTGYGFAGLLIERHYFGKNDLELHLTIGNDAALLGMGRVALQGGYYQQYSDQTNQKQIRFQNNNAHIEFTDNDGYTLSVPFGQSSVFVLNGVNFDNEAHFMKAANQFDIQRIKSELGEQ